MTFFILLPAPTETRIIRIYSLIFHQNSLIYSLIRCLLERYRNLKKETKISSKGCTDDRYIVQVKMIKDGCEFVKTICFSYPSALSSHR